MTSQNAVLIIGFKRPKETLRVVEAIKDAGRTNIYIAMDYPREERDLEVWEKVQGVFKNHFPGAQYSISSLNLGCSKRVSSAITWVLDKEDTVIVLEDDCLPHPSFFKYCDDYLEKYKDDQYVGMISGCNLVQNTQCQDSIFLSKYGGIWGWATWKRAWPRHFEEIDELKSKLLKSTSHSLLSRNERAHWIYFLNLIKRKKLDTWDYLWDAYRFHKGLLSICSNKNFIQNIGITPDALHTATLDSERFSVVLDEYESNAFKEAPLHQCYDYEKKYFEQLVKKRRLEYFKMKLVNLIM